VENLLVDFHFSTPIRCDANHQDEVGLINLPFHPELPALGRTFALIDHDVYSIVTETICKSQNTFLMFRAIMAIANECAHAPDRGPQAPPQARPLPASS
jgi:hypothetical protein